MMAFILRRILVTIPVILGVSTLTFLLIHFVPGDPVDIMLGEQASPLDKTALRRDLGLDRPLGEQYWSFLVGLAKGDLGRSLHSKAPVSDEIWDRIPATVELTVGAIFLAMAIGIPLGVIAAIRQYSWLDNSVLVAGIFGMSLPGFFLGPMLILVFSIQLDWFPVSERGGLEHLILPAASLAFALGAILMRMTRASMLEVVKSEFITVAKAKGVHPFRLYFHHALRNALMPIITTLGLQFGALLTGTVITETIFDWPGVGTLFYSAIQQRNYPLVQGCVLFISLTYVLVNLVTDLAYAAANPKVRFE